MVEKLSDTSSLLRLAASTYDETINEEWGTNWYLIAGGTYYNAYGDKVKYIHNIEADKGVLISSDFFQQQNAQLITENITLRETIRHMEERLSRIEDVIPSQKVIVLRDISKEEAKEEIVSLFSKGNTLYYSDIAEKLTIDLQVVVDICNELQQSREIEVVDDTVRKR